MSAQMKFASKKMNLTPKGPPLAATVTNISLAEVPTAKQIESIELGLERYGVLVFPDQQLSHAEQINFSNAFGELEIGNTVSVSVAGFPQLAEVGNVGNRPVSFAPTKPDGELGCLSQHHRIQNHLSRAEVAPAA